MILLNDLIITSNMIDVLQLLKIDLANKGIERFQVFKPNGKNYQTNCPFHKDGQERKPSFGINTETGQCHCFTCGWSGTIDEMISEIMLKNDNGEYGRKWLIRNFNSTEIESRKPLPINMGRNKNTIIKKPKYITAEELDSYRYTHPYMYERGLTDELIEKFDIGYDEKTDCITFPVTDINDNVVFIARRGVSIKFYNYPKEVEKPVYGLGKCIESQAKEIYICESFLNALTIWKYGLYAVALIGTGTPYQYDIIKKSNIRNIVLAFDPDEAGRKATLRARKALQKYKVISELDYIEEDKDINDLQESFLNLKKVFNHFSK